MQLLISTIDLVIQFDSSEFILKTQRQIAKDFYSSGVSFSEEFELTAISKDEILSTIVKGLDEVINSNGISQLCYQIDLPEEIYASLFNEPDFTDQLSQLILRREAYKVYMRTLY